MHAGARWPLAACPRAGRSRHTANSNTLPRSHVRIRQLLMRATSSHDLHVERPLRITMLTRPYATPLISAAHPAARGFGTPRLLPRHTGAASSVPLSGLADMIECCMHGFNLVQIWSAEMFNLLCTTAQ